MKKSERVIALDVFRGITIAAMIMVNQPGSWDFRYGQMSHSAWHGCTLTDLIFPFFLFIVGVAMWFAFQKQGQKLTPPLVKKIVRRTILIFLTGIFLNLSKQLMSTGEINLAMIRITGVLQRIAICYGIGAFMCLLLNPKQLFLVSGGILVGYWWVLWYFGGTDPYSAEHTIVSQIDAALLGQNHLRSGHLVDASGLFGSIPAVVHVIWGYLLGRIVSLNTDRKELVLKMFIWGVPAVLLAKIWDYVFPINKILWTSSYVLFSTGAALIALAFLVWIIDVNNKRGWISPVMAFGVNSLFAYVFAELWGSAMTYLIKIPLDGNLVSLKYYIFSQLFAPFAGNLNGSLLYSALIMLFYWSILWVLYQRKIYIKL